MKDAAYAIKRIREAYYLSHREYHNYSDWSSDQWDRVDEAEREAVETATEMQLLIEEILKLDDQASLERRAIYPGEWAEWKSRARLFARVDSKAGE